MCFLFYFAAASGSGVDEVPLADADYPPETPTPQKLPAPEKLPAPTPAPPAKQVSKATPPVAPKKSPKIAPKVPDGGGKGRKKKPPTLQNVPVRLYVEKGWEHTEPVR